jgi:ribosomal protein S17E
MDLKTKIEKVLSEILSDKHECKVTLRFETNTNQTNTKENAL